MSGQESRIGDSCSSFGFRRTLLAACAAVVLTAAGAPESRPAAAAELPRNQMGVTGYFDTTVSAGAAMRTQGRDSGLVGTANGGTAHSINGDDGNLNYGKGDFVSANAKVTHELQLKLNNWASSAGRSIFTTTPSPTPIARLCRTTPSNMPNATSNCWMPMSPAISTPAGSRFRFAPATK